MSLRDGDGEATAGRGGGLALGVLMEVSVAAMPSTCNSGTYCSADFRVKRLHTILNAHVHTCMSTGDMMLMCMASNMHAFMLAERCTPICKTGLLVRHSREGVHHMDGWDLEAHSCSASLSWSRVLPLSSLALSNFRFLQHRTVRWPQHGPDDCYSKLL